MEVVQDNDMCRILSYKTIPWKLMAYNINGNIIFKFYVKKDFGILNKIICKFNAIYKYGKATQVAKLILKHRESFVKSIYRPKLGRI